MTQFVPEKEEKMDESIGFGWLTPPLWSVITS
jgi:hypothetical protein